jgi:hypothetical protein
MPQYCERSGPGLWAEPLNVFTNLAFIIAAVLIWQCYRRHNRLHNKTSRDVLLLILCLFAIGIGSGLWHTFATRWAKLADVIPIALFISIFLLSVLYRIGGCSRRQLVLWFGAYQVLNIATVTLLPENFMNGSANYLPAYLALLAITVYTIRKRSPAAGMLSVAAVIFPVSLGFRTIDLTVCEQFPMGTHFLWHTLNAIMLYYLLRGLLSVIDA